MRDRTAVAHFLQGVALAKFVSNGAWLWSGACSCRGRNETSEPLYRGRGAAVTAAGEDPAAAPIALGADPSACADLFPQVLQTLGTETYRPSSASQCVAGIACAEIPMS